MNKTTTRDRVVLTLVAVLILVCGGLVLNKAAATTNASMDAVSVCVDQNPVADVTVTGDNEHPINVTGDLTGTVPVDGTLTGTVPLVPGVERVITVTVDRGDGPGKPFDLTQPVTGQTDCTPSEPPVVTCKKPGAVPPKCATPTTPDRHPQRHPVKPNTTPCGTTAHPHQPCPRDLDVGGPAWVEETCGYTETWNIRDGQRHLIQSVPKYADENTCDEDGTPALDDETGY
jgi:hypothetical protein